MKRIFFMWCLSLFIGGVYAQEKMAEIALSLPGGHVSGVALELNERIVELGVNGEGKVQAKIPVSGGEYARLWIGQGWFPVWLLSLIHISGCWETKRWSVRINGTVIMEISRN